MWIWNLQFSRTSLGFQHQTGTAETSSLLYWTSAISLNFSLRHRNFWKYLEHSLQATLINFPITHAYMHTCTHKCTHANIFHQFCSFREPWLIQGKKLRLKFWGIRRKKEEKRFWCRNSYTWMLVDMIEDVKFLQVFLITSICEPGHMCPLSLFLYFNITMITYIGVSSSHLCNFAISGMCFSFLSPLLIFFLFFLSWAFHLFPLRVWFSLLVMFVLFSLFSILSQMSLTVLPLISTIKHSLQPYLGVIMSSFSFKHNSWFRKLIMSWAPVSFWEKMWSNYVQSGSKGGF